MSEFDSKNTGVITGVVKFDPDAFEMKDGGTIGRVKIEHQHEKVDKKSQFTVKGFGKVGDEIAELVEGQAVKVKYDLVQERWKKDDEWHEAFVLRAIELKAGEAPAIEDTGDDDADDDDDIPF